MEPGKNHTDQHDPQSAPRTALELVCHPHEDHLCDGITNDALIEFAGHGAHLDDLLDLAA